MKDGGYRIGAFEVHVAFRKQSMEVKENNNIALQRRISVENEGAVIHRQSVDSRDNNHNIGNRRLTVEENGIAYHRQPVDVTINTWYCSILNY